jgi:hypothetical protein
MSKFEEYSFFVAVSTSRNQKKAWSCGIFLPERRKNESKIFLALRR